VEPLTSQAHSDWEAAKGAAAFFSNGGWSAQLAICKADLELQKR